MAGWPGPRGIRSLEEPDRASSFLACRFQRYGVRPRNRSSLARPEDDAPRSCPLLSLPSRFAHRFDSSPLELSLATSILSTVYRALRAFVDPTFRVPPSVSAAQNASSGGSVFWLCTSL